MNELPEKFIEVLKSATLSVEEKARGRQQIMAFMANHPARQPIVAPVWRRMWQRFFDSMAWSRLAYASATLGVVVMFLGGSALAAEQSLPGEALYTIKLRVNEPAARWLASSARERVNLEVSFAELRLREAEQLSVQGKLNANMQTIISRNFASEAARVQMSLNAMQTIDVVATADVSANLATKLQAHQRILKNLESAPGSTDALLQAVDEQIMAVTKTKTDNERLVTDKNNTDTRDAAMTRLRDVQNEISDLRQYLRRSQNRTKDSAFTTIQNKVDEVEQKIAKARSELQDKSYSDAFVSLGQAQQMMHETQVFAKAGSELGITVKSKDDIFEKNPPVSDRDPSLTTKSDQAVGEVRGTVNTDSTCPLLALNKKTCRVDVKQVSVRVYEVGNSDQQPKQLVRPNKQGLFELTLPPGVYALRASSEDGDTVVSCQELSLTVTAGQRQTAQLNCRAIVE